jgi:hypothetical protein
VKNGPTFAQKGAHTPILIIYLLFEWRRRQMLILFSDNKATRKEALADRSRYYPRTLPEGLRKTTKISSRSEGLESNPETSQLWSMNPDISSHI